MGDFTLFPPSFYGFLVAFPILGGNFDCHTNALEFFAEYRARSTSTSFARYVGATCVAFALVFGMTAVFGSAVYIALGADVSDDALEGFAQSPLVTAMSCAVILSVLLSYALFFNALRLSIHALIFSSLALLNLRFAKVFSRENRR